MTTRSISVHIDRDKILSSPQQAIYLAIQETTTALYGKQNFDTPTLQGNPFTFNIHEGFREIATLLAISDRDGTEVQIKWNEQGAIWVKYFLLVLHETAGIELPKSLFDTELVRNSDHDDYLRERARLVAQAHEMKYSKLALKAIEQYESTGEKLEPLGERFHEFADAFMSAFTTLYPKQVSLDEIDGAKIIRMALEKLKYNSLVDSEVSTEQQQTDHSQSPKAKQKPNTNPGTMAHKKAIERLQNGQAKEANFHQWCREYQTEKGALTEKQTPAEELYRKSVWKKFQKKLTGKI